MVIRLTSKAQTTHKCAPPHNKEIFMNFIGATISREAVVDSTIAGAIKRRQTVQILLDFHLKNCGYPLTKKPFMIYILDNTPAGPLSGFA